MAQYITFEAEVELIDAKKGKEDDEVSLISESDAFIDDKEVKEDIDLYRQYQFSNVERDINEVLAEACEEALAEIDQLDEVSNLCEGDYEPEIDDFKESNADIEKSEETLFPKVEETHQKIENQFCKVNLYAILHDKNNLKQICNKQDFEKIIDKNLIEQIYQPEKFKFIVELQAFTNMCYEIDLIPSHFGYFLRVFELKKKFRQLRVKNRDEQKFVRQLSSCLIQKFSGFLITSIQQQEKPKKKNSD